jgi:hypothetical protein
MARTLLWALTALGVLAALPLGFARHGMEGTSSEVEYVFDYRDLLMIAAYQSHPQQFVAEQLTELKEAGITTMAVFESSFEELSWAGRLTLYNSAQAAALQGEPAPLDENFAYVLFADAASRDAIAPLIERTFDKAGIPVRDWSYGGRSGFVLETPVEDAIVKPMLPDPLALEQLAAAGFHIMPRLSDNSRPYDAEEMEALFQRFAELGVTRILFEGDNVKGFSDRGELKSLDHFASLLREYGIGIAAIENLKVPQGGLSRLAYDTDYDVARLYSLSEGDAASMSPAAIADRFLLAAKDRNIRLFYINGAPLRSVTKAAIVHPLDNIKDALAGTSKEQGAVEQLADFGFEPGVAVKFDYQYAGWQKALRAVTALGAIAIIALLVGAFVPWATLVVFVLGAVGSAGLFVLNAALLEQALALGASIAVPTLAILWAFGRVRAHTEGDRRSVGGDWSSAGMSDGGRSSAAGDADKLFGGKWLFPDMSAGKRLVSAIGLYIVTSAMSVLGTAFVYGLLTNITYSLVLQQFRGVSLLHLAPMGLVALYVFLYTGKSPADQLRKLLRLQITVLWVAVAAVLGIVGMYYLSRTGNAGTASSLELLFRNVLESTFGVRPRFKEFMLAHPLFLLGLFLALRYRAAWVIMIVAAMGQLSIVDTFAHIHTPIAISLVRVLLGLGLGFLIGLALIAVWQVGEGVWRAWSNNRKAARQSA